MPFDPMTGEFFRGTLEAHRAATAASGTLFFYAARPDAFAAWTNQIMTLLSIQEGTTGVTVASGGTLIGTGAAGALADGAVPVVAMVGVWVALGSGYAEAREQARNENSLLGFAQGFTMGVLDWQWGQAASRFGRRYLKINHVDGQMDVIRVVSYNGGLKTGFGAGSGLAADARKKYRIALRRLAGISGSSTWSAQEDVARNEQISYVIALSSAGMRNGILRAQ